MRAIAILPDYAAWDAHMKRITHLLTGVAIGAVASSMLDGGYVLMLIGGAAAMLPDFDVLLTPLHKGAHRSPWSHSLGAAVASSAVWLILILLVLPGIGFEPIDGTVAVVSSVVVFLAVFAHAAGDALTRYGCMLLYPLSKRRFSGPFAYDDIAANAVLSAVSIALISLLLASAM